MVYIKFPTISKLNASTTTLSSQGQIPEPYKLANHKIYFNSVVLLTYTEDQENLKTYPNAKRTINHRKKQKLTYKMSNNYKNFIQIEADDEKDNPFSKVTKTRGFGHVSVTSEKSSNRNRQRQYSFNNGSKSRSQKSSTSSDKEIRRAQTIHKTTSAFATNSNVFSSKSSNENSESSNKSDEQLIMSYQNMIAATESVRIEDKIEQARKTRIRSAEEENERNQAIKRHQESYKNARNVFSRKNSASTAKRNPNGPTPYGLNRKDSGRALVGQAQKKEYRNSISEKIQPVLDEDEDEARQNFNSFSPVKQHTKRTTTTSTTNKITTSTLGRQDRNLEFAARTLDFYDSLSTESKNDNENEKQHVIKTNLSTSNGNYFQENKNRSKTTLTAADVNRDQYRKQRRNFSVSDRDDQVCAFGAAPIRSNCRTLFPEKYFLFLFFVVLLIF